jgi:hypothetical protein
MEPVYFKIDSEYRDKVLKTLYYKVKHTNWGAEDDGPKLSRGRKPAERPKHVDDMTKPRNKFFRYE